VLLILMVLCSNDIPQVGYHDSGLQAKRTAVPYNATTASFHIFCIQSLFCLSTGAPRRAITVCYVNYCTVLLAVQF